MLGWGLRNLGHTPHFRAFRPQALSVQGLTSPLQNKEAQEEGRDSNNGASGGKQSLETPLCTYPAGNEQAGSCNGDPTPCRRFAMSGCSARRRGLRTEGPILPQGRDQAKDDCMAHNNHGREWHIARLQHSSLTDLVQSGK